MTLRIEKNNEMMRMPRNPSNHMRTLMHQINDGAEEFSTLTKHPGKGNRREVGTPPIRLKKDRSSDGAGMLVWTVTCKELYDVGVASTEGAMI